MQSNLIENSYVFPSHQHLFVSLRMNWTKTYSMKIIVDFMGRKETKIQQQTKNSVCIFQLETKNTKENGEIHFSNIEFPLWNKRRRRMNNTNRWMGFPVLFDFWRIFHTKDTQAHTASIRVAVCWFDFICVCWIVFSNAKRPENSLENILKSN